VAWYGSPSPGWAGLGCETWPKCTDDSLTPTTDLGIRGVIEFGNRMMIYLMCTVTGLVILTARSRTPVRRDLTRLRWAQFWIIMGNAVLGGITVLTGLNPYIVSSHSLLSMALLMGAVMPLTARPGRGGPRALPGAPAAAAADGAAGCGHHSTDRDRHRGDRRRAARGRHAQSAADPAGLAGDHPTARVLRLRGGGPDR
jgi:cytochrome c oxidase assembly protein subunit 15